MALQYYTDEMLGENFAALSKFNGDVIEVLTGLTNLAERTDARLKSLENIELVVKAPKRSKLFLIFVVGASAYAGYKYAEREFKKPEWAMEQSCAHNTHNNMTKNPNPEK